MKSRNRSDGVSGESWSMTMVFVSIGTFASAVGVKRFIPLPEMYV